MEERARPASAGPLSTRVRVRDREAEMKEMKEMKRRSVHIPGERGLTQVTSSHQRPCASVPRLTHRHSSGRLGDTSAPGGRLANYRGGSSSSRDLNLSLDTSAPGGKDLNLSSDSAGPDSGRGDILAQNAYISIRYHLTLLHNIHPWSQGGAQLTSRPTPTLTILTISICQKSSIRETLSELL